MKKRVFGALLMYTIGVVKIIDWFIFWEKNKEIALRNFQELKFKFIARFPDFLKPLFFKNPEPATVISIILFIIAGIIFFKEKKNILQSSCDYVFHICILELVLDYVRRILNTSANQA